MPGFVVGVSRAEFRVSLWQKCRPTLYKVKNKRTGFSLLRK
jgi:hypothetical protein